jgi:tetratricopeptide (TPR) repeat protein
MTGSIQTPGRKKLPVLITAIFFVGGAWGAAILGTSLYDRHQYQAAIQALDGFDLDQAQEHLTKFLKHKPRDSGALLLAARTARRRGDLQAFNDHLHAYEQIQGATPAGDLEKQLLQAQEGALTQVEKSLRGKVDVDGQNSLLILEALGRGNVIAVHLPEAIDDLNQLLKKQPSNYLALYWRGKAWENWNQFEKAVENYEKALAIRPEFDQARQGYADSLNRIGRVREAVGQYDLLRRRQPDNSTIALSLAGCWEDLAQPGIALELVDDLLAKDPEYVPALVERGRIELRGGYFDKANYYLARALQSAPNDRDALFVKWLCLESQGKSEEAAACKSRLEEIQKKKTHKAALLRQVIRTPHDPAVRYELGMIYMSDGDDVQASHWLRTALAEDPKYLPARAALAKVEKRLSSADRLGTKNE